MKSLDEMLLALCEDGLSQTEIAQRVDASQSTINRILKRKHDPVYSLGRRIEQLHDDHFAAKAREDVAA